MLGHNTLRKHLHFRGHKGPVKKAYVHQASKGSSPLDILFHSVKQKAVPVDTYKPASKNKVNPLMPKTLF
jgi:hypothetical protein